jgi:acyl transferase domain-containing protein
LNCRYLNTSHAFHSEMMEPILESFTQDVKQIGPKAPKIPFISNVTGTWITPNEAMDPGYWARHARQTVRFADGIGELLKGGDQILLEVGPGQTLSTFVRLHPNRTANQLVLSSLRHPLDTRSDLPVLLNTMGQLWLSGAQIKWSSFYGQERRQRVALPTYPFQRQQYWIVEGRPASEVSASISDDSGERQGPPSPLDQQILWTGFRAILKKLGRLSGRLRNIQKWAAPEKNGDTSSRSAHENRAESGNGQHAGASQERPRAPSLAGPNSSYIGPRSDVEAVVASVWQDVLGIPQIGVHDDFFEMGGHSVLITEIIALLSRKFQMELPVLSLIESPTVAGLTHYIEAVHRIAHDGAVCEKNLEELVADRAEQASTPGLNTK